MRLGQGQMVYTAITLWTLREELLLLVAKNNMEIPYFPQQTEESSFNSA
jgi:hypothetical protein